MLPHRFAATRALLVVFLVLSGCADRPVVDLPPADANLPESGGLSGASRASMKAFLALHAAVRRDSGYVAAFARDGRVVHVVTAGYADIESRRRMTADTRFRIASMTKPVTAVAAMILIEEGRLDLEDPVARYIPVAGPLRVAIDTGAGPDGDIPSEPLGEPLMVRHLLTFTGGIGARNDDSDLGRIWAGNDLYAGSGSLAERVDRILTAPLYEQPGTVWRYGWSADVLARVVEVAAEESFGAFVRRRIIDPLGMTSTGYLPVPEDRGDIATMYTRDERRRLVPLPKGGSDAPDWTPGGSGLVSTAGDYLRFAMMLQNGGRYNGVTILKPETVALMTEPHVKEGVLADEGIDGLGWGLGLAVVVDPEATPTADREGDFWWSGYYGTTFFVSPKTGLCGVILTQNQPSPYSGRPYPVYVAQALAFAGLR